MATLKAGTYRFNDVVNAPSGVAEQMTPFTAAAHWNTYDTDVVMSFSSLYWNNRGYMTFVLVGTSPDIASMYPLDLEVYHSDSGWSTEFSEGIKTITFTEEQEVSEDFYNWFVANATEVKPKTLKGTWRFNEVLTAYSTANTTHEIPVNFKSVVDAQGVSVEFYSNKFLICYAPEYNEMSIRVNVTSSVPDISANFGFELPHELYVYSNRWYTDIYGEGIQTIDFGTEPQTVSAEFYEWLTANATQPTATIQYNGSTIATIFGGQTATVKCGGMKMETDLVVEVAEQTGGADSKTIIPLTVTENGVYDVYYETATEVWDNNTEYEGSVTVDGVTLSFKKAENLIVPDDLNELNSPEYPAVLEFIADGQTYTEKMYIDDSFDIVGGVYATFMEYAVLWVKSAAPLNAQLGISFLEDNTVYVTNFVQMMVAMQYDATYVKTSLIAPSKKIDDVAYRPVTVELPISDETLTLKSLAGQMLTQMEDVYYRHFRIEGPSAQTLNVTPSSVAQHFTPDYGKCFTEVTVGAVDLSDMTKNHILCGIYIKTMPKTEYVWGEWLDLAGGVLLAQYTDGSTQDIDMTDYDNVGIYEFTTNRLGIVPLTVKYTEGSITSQTMYNIFVLGDMLFSISGYEYAVVKDEVVTWSDFVNSKYSLNHFRIVDDHVEYTNGVEWVMQAYGDTINYVKPTDVIIEGHDYGRENISNITL